MMGFDNEADDDYGPEIAPGGPMGNDEEDDEDIDEQDV